MISSNALPHKVNKVYNLIRKPKISKVSIKGVSNICEKENTSISVTLKDVQRRLSILEELRKTKNEPK